MPKTRISLDRLLETCYRQRASDALVAPNAQVLIRLAKSWRAAETLSAQPADIEQMCQALFKGDKVIQEAGYAAVDFGFGDVAQFRAMAFGYPSTQFLMISRYPESGERDELPPLPAGL